ncbi:MAG: hypothetical protein ACXV4C_07755 [Halobacteriota archaeon]
MHAVGGVIGLVGAWMLGPRIGVVAPTAQSPREALPRSPSASVPRSVLWLPVRGTPVRSTHAHRSRA